MINKLAIGTPLYDDNIKFGYHESLLHTYIKLVNLNYDPCLMYSKGHHTASGRNVIVGNFLNLPKEYSHLIFIDSDIVWDTDEFFDALQKANDEILVVSGSYSKKTFNKQILKIENNIEQNLGTQMWSHNYIKSEGPNKLYEVNVTSSGFLLIDRRVFTKIINLMPEIEYVDNLYKTNYKLYEFFRSGVFHGNMISDDIYFSTLCNRCDIKIYFDPNIKLSHIGTMEFTYDSFNYVREFDKENNETCSYK